MDQHTFTYRGSLDLPAPRDPAPQHESVARLLFRNFISTVIPALLIALFIHLFLAQATRVFGESMEPNLHSQQRLVVEKITYRFRNPDRGEVVVLHDPTGSQDLIIKRVIGLPGEQITFSNGSVYVNGQPIDEPYLDAVTQSSSRTWVVPEDSVFVMGDNRRASRDSRSFGPVSQEEIIGRAVFRYWPLNDLGVLN
jgi:signal peptidase I